MQYVGSKKLIAKYILPLILKDRKHKQFYIEPFAGGFNSIQYVAGPRIASDINPFITALFKQVINGWVPPDWVSKLEYDHIKNNKDKYPEHLVGFVGITSWGGKFFGGYPRHAKINDFNVSIIEQCKMLQGVKIHTCSYDDLKLPNKSIIYCDPPYTGVLNYGEWFDHDKFWRWCRQKKKEGHQIFISEYRAPQDFKLLWSKEVSVSLGIGQNKPATEKLFTL